MAYMYVFCFLSSLEAQLTKTGFSEDGNLLLVVVVLLLVLLFNRQSVIVFQEIGKKSK